MNKFDLKNRFVLLIKSDLFQELIYSAIGCGLFTLLFFLFPDKCWNRPYLVAICTIIIMGFLIAFLIFNQINPKNKIFKVNYKINIILFSIFLFSIMCFLYFKTRLSTNGFQGDNYYRTAYVTHMAHSGYPQDFAYKNLSGFVGPLYWYCLALFSRIFQIKPYRMLKLGMLFLYYFLPILLYEVWKKIYSKKIAFIISSLSLVLIFNAYSPDRMIVIFCIVPFIMYFLENCTEKQFYLKDYIIAGVLGAILFCIYFLLFLIIPVYLLLSFLQNTKKFFDNIFHILKIFAFVMIFSIWFWGPIIKDIIFIGFESHQNNYFVGEPPAEAVFYRYYSTSFIGIFLFIGIVFIVISYKRFLDLRSLGNIIISVNLIFLIGVIGIFFKLPIMHVRFYAISTYSLLISTSVFIVKLIPYLEKSDFIRKKNIKPNLKYIESYILIGLIFARGYLMIMGTYESEAYFIANEDDVRYDLIDILEELDYEDKVFLTNNKYAAAFKPIYLFLLPNPYFTHPNALYNERVKFLEELSECKDSKDFHDKVTNNEFDTIDYFWLDSDNSSDLVFEFAVETYPEGRDYYEVKFKIEFFEDTRYFKRHDIKGDVIYETR